MAIGPPDSSIPPASPSEPDETSGVGRAFDHTMAAMSMPDSELPTDAMRPAGIPAPALGDETSDRPAPEFDTAPMGQDWVARDNRAVVASMVITPSSTSRFVLRSVLGRGGFGEVWESVQTSLWRLIAIKKPRSDDSAAALDPTAVRAQELQFMQEAMTMASLDHPNIVPVYDLGVDGNGHPVVAMKKVRGVPWQDLIMAEFNASTPQKFLERHVPILIDVANATGFAHSRGIIHRDIKPGQVIVGEFGETLLTDWGIAVVYDTDKAGEHSPLLLESGYAPDRKRAISPAGTVAFMAPEQTMPTALEVGPWTDIYLLGGTLYYLLTGRPPHDGQTPDETLAMAGHGFVAPVERANAHRFIPAELAELAMRCMAPSPKQRPPSTDQVVAELRAWLSGTSRRREAERIIGRVTEQLSEGNDHYEALTEWESELVRALALCPEDENARVLREAVIERFARAALVNGDLVLARAHAGRLADASRSSRIMKAIEAELAVRARHRVQRFSAIGLSSALFVLVLIFWFLARERANEAVQGQASAMLETQRRDLLARRADEKRRRAEKEQYIATMQFAQSAIADGRQSMAAKSLITAPVGERGWEWGWLMRLCHQELLTLLGHKGPINEVRFVPDGSLLVTAGEDGQVGMFRTWDGVPVRFVRPTGAAVRRVRVSPNGKLLMAVLKDGAVATWSIDALDKPARILANDSSEAHDVEFTPDSKHALVLHYGNDASLWDLESGKVVRKFSHRGFILSASFSPDGKRLATAALDRTVGLWSVDSGTQDTTITQSPPQDMRLVRWSPDGKYLLTGDGVGLVRLLLAKDATEIQQFTRGEGAVMSGQFSPDGRLACATFRNRGVGVWEVDAARQLYSLTRHKGEVAAVAFGPRGRRMATGSKDTNVRLSDAYTGADMGVFPGHTDQVRAITFSPDGRYLASGAADGTARIWLAHGLDAYHALEGNAGPVWDMRFDPDSRHAITAGADGTIRWWDAFTGVEQRQWSPSSGLRIDSVASTPDGQWWASGGLDCRATLWKVPPGESPLSVSMPLDPEAVRVVPKRAGKPNYVLGVALPAAGGLITCSYDGGIRLWNRKTGVLEQTFFGHDSDVRCVDVSPDGNWLVSCGDDETVRLWSMDGATTSVVGKHAGSVATAEFSPSGERIVSASHDGTARVWTAGGELLATLAGHADELRHASYDPFGERIVTASKDGTAKVWNPEEGRELVSIAVHGDLIQAARFSPDGNVLGVASADKTVTFHEAMPWQDAKLNTMNETSFTIALAAWQRERTLRYAKERPDMFVPNGWALATTFADADDTTGQRHAIRGLARMVNEMLDGDATNAVLAVQTVSLVQQLIDHLPPMDRTYSREWSLNVLHGCAQACLVGDRPTSSAAILCLDAYRLAVSQWTLRRLPVHDTALILDTLSRLLVRVGLRDEAIAVQRRAVLAAWLAVPRDRDLADQDLGLKGIEFTESAERWLRELGSALPADPPDELIFGTNRTRTNWLPGWISIDRWRMASSAEQNKIIDEMDERLRAYLDKAAPLPDFALLRQRLASGTLRNQADVRRDLHLHLARIGASDPRSASVVTAPQ